MEESLQNAFIRTRGKPIERNGHSVIQLDKIPPFCGSITIRFLSAPCSFPVQGVRLRAEKDGKITMSDGNKAKCLDIWHEPSLPPVVRHEVAAPHGLTLNNIYRNIHNPGFVTVDQFTGNAGMVLLASSATSRRYGCSDWKGKFDVTDLEFEVEWQTKECQPLAGDCLPGSK